MGITDIPKLAIWTGIAVFVLFLIYLGYSYIKYNFMKPYERYFVADCYFSNNNSLVVITAKADIYEINITNLYHSDYCFIKKLSKDSMDACKINNTLENGKAIVKIVYSYGNNTYSAIVECKVEEKKGLLSWLFGK